MRDGIAMHVALCFEAQPLISCGFRYGKPFAESYDNENDFIIRWLGRSFDVLRL